MTRGPLTPVTVRYSAWGGWRAGERSDERGRGGATSKRDSSSGTAAIARGRSRAARGLGAARTEPRVQRQVLGRRRRLQLHLGEVVREGHLGSTRVRRVARSDLLEGKPRALSRSRAAPRTDTRGREYAAGTLQSFVFLVSTRCAAPRARVSPGHARSARVGVTPRALRAMGDAPPPALSGKARYLKGAVLGEGTFGVVTKAEDTLTRKAVAIKKIRLGKYKEGVNFTAIREIKLLQELRHPHVIELVDVFPHKRNLHLVFECCESDLEAVVKDKFLPLGVPEIKSYVQMTLKAVAYCHSCWVLHRDLKPNNLLIAPNGALKLADFGLARVFGSPNRRFTHQVFARWYRAPELLLGSKIYGPGVDLWAVGCIFAELMLRRPFVPGSSDIDQLGRIYQQLGTPTEETWPGHKNLPDYMEFSRVPPPPLRDAFPSARRPRRWTSSRSSRRSTRTGG